MGQATLVPPHICQTNSGASPGMLIAITTPVYGSASHAMSGTCRVLPCKAFWNAGFGNPARQFPLLSWVAQLLEPPPDPPWKPSVIGGSKMSPCCSSTVALFPQPACHAMELSEFNASVTPPTPVAHGESAGALTVCDTGANVV